MQSMEGRNMQQGRPQRVAGLQHLLLLLHDLPLHSSSTVPLNSNSNALLQLVHSQLSSKLYLQANTWCASHAHPRVG